jgi:DNA adenine methylase
VQAVRKQGPQTLMPPYEADAADKGVAATGAANTRIKPFLKWAGGKTQLLPVIRSLLPPSLQVPDHLWGGRYFEPFMGSAAVFFDQAHRLDQAYLSDMNRELVLTFIAVRDHLPDLLEGLEQHAWEHDRRNSEDRGAQRRYFERIRAMDRQAGWHDCALEDTNGVVQHAARFIYLNRTCFNGLWRVNSKGHNNVPMGRHREPAICREGALRAAHAALQGVAVAHQGYEHAVAGAREGDLVYFDPPYMPLSATSSFNAYARNRFLEPEHKVLAAVFLVLASRGVHVIMSNSDTPFTRLPLGPKDDPHAFRALVAPILAEHPVVADVAVDALLESYRACWHVHEVSATRAINSKAGSRGAVSEIIVTSHPPQH